MSDSEVYLEHFQGYKGSTLVFSIHTCHMVSQFLVQSAEEICGSISGRILLDLL